MLKILKSIDIKKHKLDYKCLDYLTADEVSIISKYRLKKAAKIVNKNLFLIVTKYYYDKIASGEKRVEYRGDGKTGYWRKKFTYLKANRTFINQFDTVEFQCGYSRKYPRLKFQFEKIIFIKTPESVKKTVKTEYCFAIYFK